MARKRTTQASGSTILVIDDQEEILISVQMLLEREGHTVLTAQSGQEGLALFRQHLAQLVIVDFFMPEMTGEEVVREIRKLDTDVQILLQTGYSGEKPPREMLQALDIQGYHDKTDGPERLLFWVEVALKAAAQVQRVRETEQLKTKLLLKQDFLTNASHEMRTPLHIILGYSEMLLESGEPVSPHARQAAETIQRQGRALYSLVNNFLNFIKLEAESMETTPHPVRLADLTRECQDLMNFLLRNKPITFLCQIPSNLPLAWADREKLQIIVRNLLSNAAKFTDMGEIRLTATAMPSGDKIELLVSDTGKGIALEHHETIFAAFRRVGESSGSSSGGIGIGLALSRRLARMMGGDITVESAPGKGTTFTVALKAHAATAYVQATPTPSLLPQGLNSTASPTLA